MSSKIPVVLLLLAIIAWVDMVHALPMSTATYRRKFGLESDEHVSHIVARANGGVDDSDNYMALSGPFNQLLGKHGDHIMCALAGKTKCKRAVTVSGVDVESEELFESGMATLRQLKKEMKTLR